MNVSRGVAGLLTLLCFGNGAWAQSDSHSEIPRGLWQSQPDDAGIVFHVRTKRCGRALCGRVERVKNRRGYDTPSNAVGQKVLWDLKPQPDGSFYGEVRGTRGQSFEGSRVERLGNALHLRTCQGDDCTEQVWQRLR